MSLTTISAPGWRVSESAAADQSETTASVAAIVELSDNFALVGAL